MRRIGMVILSGAAMWGALSLLAGDSPAHSLPQTASEEAGAAADAPPRPVKVARVGSSKDEKPATDKDGSTEDLTGSVWSGVESDGRAYVFRLEKGELHYDSPSGSFKNGSWKQSGAAVYMQVNNHYSERLGTYYGRVIRGVGWNEAGDEWTWKLERRKE